MAAGADEGTGDHPAHAVLALQDPPGNTAVLVELLQRDDLLMGRNLEDGVSGGVDNQVPGLHMLVAEFVDDGGAGPGGVGQDAAARGLPEGLQHLLGEAVGIGRHGIRGDDAGNLPVADGGVLAHGGLGQLAVGAAGFFNRSQEFQTRDIAETGCPHVGDRQQLGSGAGAQGVDAYVAELGGVPHFTGAAGVQDK